LEFLSKPSDRPIHIKWVNHLRDPDEREKFKQALRSSAFVFRILKDIIEQEKRSINASELNPNDFESPAWAQKQAFRNGERRGLQIVEELLDFIG
jgi:hypothetical protein